eukprot:2465955-Prymnesium_polylepis.1
MAAAPASPILFAPSRSWVSAPLTFRASAIAMAPWSPMSLNTTDKKVAMSPRTRRALKMGSQTWGLLWA